MTIVATMVKLFATMLLGVYLGRKGVFDPSTCKKLSGVIVNISGPALVLSSITSMGGVKANTVFAALIFGAAVYVCLPFLGFLFAKGLRVEKDLVGTYILTVLLCNNSFMGYPVVQAMLGDEAIFFTTMIHFGFNIMFYGLGLALIQKDVNADNGEKFKWTSMINPGTIAAVVVMVIFFGQVKIPEVVAAPFSFVGELTMPLSMIIIGANMSQYELKEVFGNKKMYLISIMRLIVVPFLVWFVMRYFISDSYLIKVATITFAMPCAALIAMATAPYEKQGKVGALAVAFTTICSLATIPLWAIFLGI